MDQPNFLLQALTFLFVAATPPLLMWGFIPIWDQIVENHIADLTPQMEAMNMDTDALPMYMRLWGLAMAGVAVVFGAFLQMIPIAGGLMLLVYTTPRALLQGAIKTRRTMLRDQLVGSSVALGNSCRAGLSLPQAFDTVSRELPEPLATEFKRIVRDYQGGRPFHESLMDVKKRLDLDSFTLFASAILVCLQAGGNVTAALEKISLNLQENQRLERKLEADTESGRKVVLILAAFPWVFLGGFYLMEPEGVGLMFTTLPGNIIVLAIGALVFLAYKWAMAILAIDI